MMCTEMKTPNDEERMILVIQLPLHLCGGVPEVIIVDETSYLPAPHNFFNDELNYLYSRFIHSKTAAARPIPIERASKPVIVSVLAV